MNLKKWFVIISVLQALGRPEFLQRKSLSHDVQMPFFSKPVRSLIIDADNATNMSDQLTQYGS